MLTYRDTRALIETGLPEVTDSNRPNTLGYLPEGVAGIRATLNAMLYLTRQFLATLEIRDLAEAIIAGIPNKDYDGEIEAIQQWVRDNIRYTRDPYNVETLKTPLELIASRQGDCDDQALLVGTLAASIGFPVRYVAIGNNADRAYDHVYCEVKLGTVWVSVETTECVSIGWQPQSNIKPMIRHL